MAVQQFAKNFEGMIQTYKKSYVPYRHVLLIFLFHFPYNNRLHI
jgi:hypothetical protein